MNNQFAFFQGCIDFLFLLNRKGKMMEYLTEYDLNAIDNNTFRVPRFLFSGSYQKISADSKLLFALMMERQSTALDELGKESGYSLTLMKKCVKELTKAGLIQVQDPLILITQMRRIL
jgi:hypothetical protein